MYFCKSNNSIDYAYINFSTIKYRHSSGGAYDFVKMVKIRKISDGSCNVERYPTIIWTCQHSISALKNPTGIQAQHVLPTLQNKEHLDRVFFHRKQKWLVSEL